MGNFEGIPIPLQYARLTNQRLKERNCGPLNHCRALCGAFFIIFGQKTHSLPIQPIGKVRKIYQCRRNWNGSMVSRLKPIWSNNLQRINYKIAYPSFRKGSITIISLLIAPMSKIIKDVWVTELMMFPPQKKKKFPLVNKSKYCKFHQNYGHDTNECVSLKDEIETSIRIGELMMYKWYRDQNIRNERIIKREWSHSLRKGQLSNKMRQVE